MNAENLKKGDLVLDSLGNVHTVKKIMLGTHTGEIHTKYLHQQNYWNIHDSAWYAGWYVYNGSKLVKKVTIKTNPEVFL